MFENIPSTQKNPFTPVSRKQQEKAKQSDPKNVISSQLAGNAPEGVTVLEIDTHESSINRRNILLVVGVLLGTLVILTVGGFFLVQNLASKMNTPETPEVLSPLNTTTNKTTNATPAPVNTSPVTTPTNSTPSIAPSGVCVYQNQVVENPTADTDSDGLLDGQESLYGTSILLADTDGDKYFDGQEVSGGYNPCGQGKLP